MLNDIRARAVSLRCAAIHAANHGMRGAAIMLTRKAQECDERAQEWQAFVVSLGKRK